MKIASMLALTLLVSMSAAGMDTLSEISEKVTAAFDHETRTFLS